MSVFFLPSINQFLFHWQTCTSTDPIKLKCVRGRNLEARI